MPIHHFYESTIIDSELDITTTFIVVPTSQLPLTYQDMSRDRSRLIEDLELKIEKTIDPGWIMYSIADTLAKSKDSDDLRTGRRGRQQLNRAGLSNEYYRFAEYIALSPLVPIENSPVKGKSLGEALTDTQGVGFGAVIGYVISGFSPMLVFWVPAGMIFFGAVSGIANGLSEGLRERIKKLIIKGK